MMFTESPQRRGVVQRVVADGVVFYADDDSVALFVPFDQVDVAKSVADAERKAQVLEGRRQAVSS